MSTIEPAALPGEVIALVDRFQRNRDEYRSAAYNETQARRELIDPFFTALGWDVDNRAGVAEAYKDVIHEDAIRVGGSTKAPDYCFRIGGTRKFFVEAKKPGVDLKTNPEPAYQLRRYAWTSKLPLSILTDFEEFAVYDCRVKPAAADKASVARVFYCTCDDYADRWSEIAGLFSKDAILKGAFDRYAESARKKRGTAEVDQAFLEEIEGWRDVLARNIALRNADLSQRDLNFAVQRTIDRIIFLRICEDRAIEPHGQLLSLVNGEKIYERLCSVFRRADEKYNSGIFHFEREKDRAEPPDTLTPALAIDDKVLRDILKSLYYPDSPYEFSVLPADILGHVYEQFLGKVIRLTAGHRAVVEEKPEVRKAGGVYYTPTYIVDYIVRNTVGRLLGDGDWGPGAGDRGLGDEAMNAGSLGDGGRSDVDQALPGSGSLAGGDDARRAGVSTHEDISSGGALRPDQPDAAGGGVGAGERGGGARPHAPGRLPASPVDRARVAGGTGDTPGACGPTGVGDARGGSPDLGPVPERRQAPERAHRRVATPESASPQLPASDPRAPAPQPLTPKEAAKLRILDPACGSGSFLIGAYQYLLDWHLRWYAANDPDKWCKAKNPPLRQIASPQSPAPGPSYRLTIAERKRILLNNIYGVDIDPQAVEVTKLSLLLKVLEGESGEVLASQWRLLHERALPDLGRNIKCGNSLIGPDFYHNQQMLLLGEDERLRINVFDWNAEFPEIMKAGGFDAVIGNPPYSYRNSTEQALRPYYTSQYLSAEGNFDTYKFFLERAARLLNAGGLLGMIVSATFLVQPTFTKLRRFLLENTLLRKLAPLGPGVFDQATVDTAIVIVEKGLLSDGHDVAICVPSEPRQLPKTPSRSVSQARFSRNDGHVFDYRLSDTAAALLERMASTLPTLGQRYELGVGINTGYIRDELVRDRKLDSRFHPMIPGNGISRYGVPRTAGWIMYDPEYVRGRGKLGRTLPAEHLLSSDKILVVRTRNLSLPRRIIATLDTAKGYNLNRLSNIVATGSWSLPGLLGILNSQLSNWIFSTRFFDYEIKPIYLRSVPLADCNDQRLVALANTMLSLHRALAASKSEHTQAGLRRQIGTLDRQIDQLVYELYGLTDDEIRIVEEATAR